MDSSSSSRTSETGCAKAPFGLDELNRLGEPHGIQFFDDWIAELKGRLQPARHRRVVTSHDPALLSVSNSSSDSSISAAATFSSRWATFDVPGIGSITGDRFSSHASASCDGVASWSSAMRCSGPPGAASGPAASGNQGMNPMPCASQASSSGSAARTVRLYMFCTDTIGGDLLRGFELLDVDLGQPDVADLALLLQRDEFADLVLGGKLVVDAVQLEQVDGVDAEAAQAHLALLAQVGREAEHRPFVGPGAQQTGLGRDDDAVGIRVQRLADQFLGYVRAVGVRGVDEVDAEFDGAAQNADAFVAVGGRAPDALTGQAHGAESQAVDGEVAADGECSRCLSDALRGHFSDRTPRVTSVAR